MRGREMKKQRHKEFGLLRVHINPWATCLYIQQMSLIKLKVLSAPLSTIRDFFIITIGGVGAVWRDRKGRKVDTYCGCIMTVKERRKEKQEEGMTRKC